MPKTIFVDITTQEPRQVTTMVNESRTRTVKVPYTAMVPQTRSKRVTQRVPVNKTKTVWENRKVTKYKTEIKAEWHPVTEMVCKEFTVKESAGLSSGNAAAIGGGAAVIGGG